MKEFINLLEATKLSPERVEYHPEKYLGRHIALVTLRALFTGVPELIFAGLLHDIHKPTSGEMKNGYWFNPWHPREAEDWIVSYDPIRYMMRSYDCNWETVARICRYHMACKDKVIKKARSIPYMDKFPVLDDMVNRKAVKYKRGFFYIPGMGDCVGEITHVGMSPIQIRGEKDEFTLTFNRRPFTYKFSEIPSFFKGRWEFLTEYLNIIV